MLDKRTSRSQNYSRSQLQQQQKQSSTDDVIPPPKFDFTLADPAFGNIYEMLKVTQLYLCATNSPVSSTMFNIIQQFEQLAIHTTSTVAKYAIQSKLIPMAQAIPSTDSKQSVSTISTPIFNRESIAADANSGTFYSLLESSADQLEVNCSLLEQNIQLSSQLHDYKSNLAICETENLRLDACLDQLQAYSNGLADTLLLRDAAIARLTATITAVESDISQIHSENVQLRAVAPKSISTTSFGYGGNHFRLQYTESVYSPKSDFLTKLTANKCQTSLRGAHRVYR